MFKHTTHILGTHVASTCTVYMYIGKTEQENSEMYNAALCVHYAYKHMWYIVHATHQASQPKY